MAEFERERQLGFMEIPEVLRPIIRVLERLDEIKGRKFIMERGTLG
jgi:hypothetical protein